MRFSGQRLKRVRPLLGTFVSIEVSADADEDALSAWIARGFDAIIEVERLMSFHREDSDLSRLNRAAPTDWVVIDPLTAEVLDASNRLHLASRGVFDLRCGAVLVRHGVLPPPASSGGCVNWRGRGQAVELRGARARKTGRWTLDLGGIAKGFAVDRAVEAIGRAAAGRRHTGVVNAGGDLRAWGSPAQAVVRCRAGMAPVKVLRAAATSAARRQAHAEEGLTPADHIRMPSGISCRRPETVTVFAERCLIADALTKVALLGSEKVAASCLSAYRAKAVLFSADGGVTKALG